MKKKRNNRFVLLMLLLGLFGQSYQAKANVGEKQKASYQINNNEGYIEFKLPVFEDEAANSIAKTTSFVQNSTETLFHFGIPGGRPDDGVGSVKFSIQPTEGNQGRVRVYDKDRGWLLNEQSSAYTDYHVNTSNSGGNTEAYIYVRYYPKTAVATDYTVAIKADITGGWYDVDNKLGSIGITPPTGAISGSFSYSHAYNNSSYTLDFTAKVTSGFSNLIKKVSADKGSTKTAIAYTNSAYTTSFSLKLDENHSNTHQTHPVIYYWAQDIPDKHGPLITEYGRGSINVPAFNQAVSTSFGGAYSQESGVVDVKWTVNTDSHSNATQFIAGGTFQLQRSTDANFNGNVENFEIPFNASQANYSQKDNISDISGSNQTIYYRIKRIAPEGSWSAVKTSWDNTIIYRSMSVVNIEPVYHACVKDGAKVTLNEEKGEATITWETQNSYWSQNSQLIIEKFNKTQNRKESDIVLGENIFLGKTYTDNSLAFCTEYTYKMYVKPGGNGHTAQTAVEVAGGPVLLVDLGKISAIKASKGYYPGHTSIEWSTIGGFDEFAVKRKEYGKPGEASQIGIVSATTSGSTYTYNDELAVAGVLYQYEVTGSAKCGGKTFSSSVSCIGFRAPTGNIYGRVTFENGQGVAGADIRLSNQASMNGYSMQFGGTAGDYLETYDTLSQTGAPYAMQAYVRPEKEKASGSLLTKGIYELGLQEGKPFFRAGTEKVEGSHIVKNGSYTHLSGVYASRDGKDTIFLYINNINESFVYKKAVTAIPATQAKKVVIGKSFQGNIDEVRIWDKGLDISEIQRDYNRMLSGNEAGLQAYWRFNDPIGNEFFDCSYFGTEYNEHHGKANGSVKLSERIPGEEQLSFRGVTDNSGNYHITGIPYSGNGTQYTLTPYYGIHQFSPNEKTIILGTSSASFNIDFVDKSSFAVSGVVYYANSTVPVADVMFHIDGTPASRSNGELIKSDENGSFTINVPVGTHEVKAIKQNHTFKNEGKLVNSFGADLDYQDDISGIRFWDNTTVRLAGRVSGGIIQESYPTGHSQSVNNLGDDISITLTLKERPGDLYIVEDGDVVKEKRDTTFKHLQPEYANKVTYTRKQIQIKADPKTGEYVADLIPEAFNVTGIHVTGYGNLIENVARTVDLTNVFTDSYSLYPEAPEGNTKQDSVKYNALFNYRLDVTPVFGFREVADSAGLEPKAYFGSKEHQIMVYTQEGNQQTKITLYDTEKGAYPFGMPVYKQGGWYNFLIESYYPYYYNNDQKNKPDKVPVSDGAVAITNTFKSETAKLDLDGEGKTVYRFQADNPDVNATQQGLRSLQMAVTTGGYTTDAQKQEGYLLGGKSKGQDFVTEGPNELLMVLRDPPGSKSYAYVEKGMTLTTSKGEIKNGFFQEGDEVVEHLLGIKISTSVGVGFQTTTEVESENTIGIQVTHHEEGQEDHVSIDEITTTSRIETSDDPLYVGANGDVLVGRSNNIILGALDEVDIKPTRLLKTEDRVIREFENGFSIYSGTSLSVGTRFKTLFAYPQIHIEEVIIPQIEGLISHTLEAGLTAGEAQSKANSTGKAVYVSKLDSEDENFGKPNPGTILKEDGDYYTIYFPTALPESEKKDTIDILYSSRQNWIDLLEENEKEKVSAQKITGSKRQNYSLQAGSRIEHAIRYSHASETTKTFSFQAGAGIHGQLGASINGFGIRFTAQETAGKIGGNSSGSGSVTDQTIGFVFADEGDFDYLSIDVVAIDPDTTGGISSEELEGNFVYRLRGGATACPFEDVELTKYYEPGAHKISDGSLQVEIPKIEAFPHVVSNVPSNNPAVFTLKLYNDSEAKADVWFDLRLVDSTIPHGAKFSIDGVPLSDGRRFLVPSSEILTKTLEVRMGAGSYDYEDMKLVLTSQCQNDPTTFQEVIADTVTLSAHFIPTSTELGIKSPGNNWTLNTACDTLPGGIYYIPVTVHNFDVNYRDLDRIEVQYKPMSESKQWSVLKTFYCDETRITRPETEEYIGTQTTLTACFTGQEDQRYDIRAVSYCTYGTSEISYESEIISGIKDTKRPVLFGSPQPADGILDPGDEIQLNFSEDIAEGYLTQANFEVKAIKNGAIGNHDVSVKLDGDNDYLATEFERNMSGKSLTVEMWVKPENINRGGTLFSHGNAREVFEIALAAGNRLEVTFGAGKKSGTVEMKPDEWANISVVYDAEKSRLTAYYNYETVIDAGNVSPYTGAGRFGFGKNASGTNYFAGNIHEVRVWEKAVSLSDIKSKGLTVLSGMEPALMAYYPMNEAKGTLVSDKARGNNALLNGEWSTPDGRAVAFGGNGYAAINSSEIPIRSDQNFTLEFWFRSDKADQASAALVCNGKADGNEEGSSADKFFIGFEKGKLIFRSKEHSEEIEGDYRDQAWHHFALSVNRISGHAQVFMDGELRKYFDSGHVGALSAPYIYLGACFWTGKDGIARHTDQFFTGQIDEFRLWNGALPQSIIASQNNVKMDGNEMGLIAYYPFEKYIINEINLRELVFAAEDMADKKYAVELVGGATETTRKAPLKSKGPEEPILHTFVVNKDALIITLTEPDERIEKTIVNFAVKRVRDLNGNESDGTVRWNAYIDRNQLKWSESEIVKESVLRESLEFTVTLNNTGGSVKNYTIDNLPVWLSATPASGKIDPKGSRKISFVVNEGLNAGYYDEVIYARAENNVAEPLSLKLKINGKKPDWNVDPGNFKYNMSIFGKLRFDNLFSTDKEDMLAAFEKGKCIGVGNCTYNAEHDLWYVFLTVYNNNVQADGIEFRMWDSSTGRIYGATPDQNITFVNNKVFGTLQTPVIFEGKETFYQDMELMKGWNWVSFNLSNPDFANVTAALANGTWTSNDMIKDADNFDSYSLKDRQWLGTLSNAGGLNHTSLYILHSSDAQTLSTYGMAINPPTVGIQVKGNSWNYIGYLPDVNLTLKEALGGYDAGEGDILKSQSQFAMFSGNEWTGNLTYMEPGKGYMLLRKASGSTSFSYPSARGTLSKAFAAYGDSDPVYLNTDHADNMTVVAVSDDMEKDDRALAYIDGELRGVSQNVTYDGKEMKFITIAGSDADKTVYFELERNGKAIASSNTKIGYRNHSANGTPDEPLILDFSKANGQISLYPVPFTDRLYISIAMEESARVQIAIYDLAGRLVWRKDEKAGEGVYRTVWNSSAHGSGGYLVHLTIGEKTSVFKVIKR